MKFLNKKSLLSLLFSLFALLGFTLYFNIQKNNILLIPILYFIYKAFIKTISSITTKDVFFCSVLSILYSTMLILGFQLDNYNGIIYNAKTLITLICLPFLIFLIVNKILLLFTSLKIKNDNIVNEKKLKLSIFGGIFIPWLLGFLALFPGIYGYDAGFQFMQFDILETGVTSHFSILYSYIFYFFVNLGNTLFNSYQIGFAIYSFMQLNFLSFVAYKVCYYIYTKFKNIKILIGAISFFALSPFNMILAISSCQDSIFAGIFVLVILQTLKMVENNSDFWSSWKQPLLYFILVFLLCAIRNNAFYAFIITIPFGLIFLKKNKFKFAVLSLLVITIFQVYKGPIHNLLNVKKGNSLKEMSSVIVQQLGRIYCYKRDTLTDEELTYITQLIPQNILEIYQFSPCISDSLKGSLNDDFLKSDFSSFIKNYFSIGLKNPETYLEAFLLNNIGTWYPNKTYPDSRMYHPYIEYEMLDAKKWNENYIVIERNSLFPAYEKLLNIFVNKTAWNNIPIVSTLFSAGTYFFIFIFVIFYLIYTKKYNFFIPLSLVLGLYLTILLAPVTLYRYIYPIILSIPLICSTILKTNEENIR